MIESLRTKLILARRQLLHPKMTFQHRSFGLTLKTPDPDAVPLSYKCKGPLAYQSLVEPEDYVCLKLRGIPFSSQTVDILKFFDGYPIIENSVKFQHFNDGKKSGNVACLFHTPQDATTAMEKKQGASIGNRWIEI